MPVQEALYGRIRNLIQSGAGFKSVSDHLIYVLMETVAMYETKTIPESFTSSDFEQIRARLKV